MSATLTELFRHNLWANLRLLDACAGLDDEQLNASTPGTYGRVRDTLIHICSAEERYVSALTGQAPEAPLRADGGFPGFEELRQRARRSGEELIKVAEQVQPTAMLQGVRQGKPYTIQSSVLLIQAINHATEHRSQVMTILSQVGVTPPTLDGWTYGQEHGQVELGVST